MVCEEAPEPRTYGTRTKQKQRFVAGIVTPAQPHYLYGLLDANMDPSLGGTPPILAIATSAGGYKACFLSSPHFDSPKLGALYCKGFIAVVQMRKACLVGGCDNRFRICEYYLQQNLGMQPLSC